MFPDYQHWIANGMTMEQNFFGYGGNSPDPMWPHSARVAVSLVLNVEEGSERAISNGDSSNETVYDMVQDSLSEPDLVMESHFRYGTRAGYWRIIDLLQRYSATCTLNVCADALLRTPWIAKDGLERGYEFACHGERWKSPIGLAEQEERDMIRRAVAKIKQVAGVRPVGWHSRSPHTPNTRRLLIEEGGFTYDSEAYDDDLPYFVTVNDRKHVVVPYSLDTNDMRFQRIEAPFVKASDFSDYVIDAFDWLWKEGASNPKMMTIGLHSRTIGRPGRIGSLETILRHMTEKGKVWFATRSAIADHWRSRFGAQ
jgi:peptidoglycan/xylan/chitin deacetylase (PgdA/CDA1 family)